MQHKEIEELKTRIMNAMYDVLISEGYEPDCAESSARTHVSIISKVRLQTIQSLLTEEYNRALIDAAKEFPNNNFTSYTILSLKKK